MTVDYNLLEKYLSGKTTPEESMAVLTAIATNPEFEEFVVTQRRLDYEEDKLKDYGSFIPASSMAADDGRNLCDLQCELFILRKFKRRVSESTLSMQSRRNYWLRDQGTPLYNVGRLLESKGFLVNKIYNATLETLKESLKNHHMIAIVNGDVLEPMQIKDKEKVVSLDDEANHAVVVLSISPDGKSVTLYNPANGEKTTTYKIDSFIEAWIESSNYLVAIRKKAFPEEYVPQPIDVESIPLSEDLLDLTEMIAENAHDVWAKKRMEEGWTYGPVRDDAKKHNPDMVPYAMLPEKEKQYDRDMAFHTIKLVKRLGYRIVNISSMFKCQECGEVLEPNFHYCPSCGKRLTWEDFK